MASAKMADPSSDAAYRRKLDRTPEDEKSNIAKLSEEDRRKIYGLRSAFENTLSKLQRLEDTVDEKELAVERERELRKNLEDKLAKIRLVDMYPSPAVNEELHDRLPRAAKDRHSLSFATPRATGKSRRKHLGRHSKKRGSEDDETSSSDENPQPNQSFPGAFFYPPTMYPSSGFYSYPPQIPPMQFVHSTPNHAPGHPSWSFPHGVSDGSHQQAAESSKKNNNSSGNAAEDLNIVRASNTLSMDSQARQIARLLQEIDLLKDQNRKLSEELSQKANDNDRLRMEQELRAAQADGQQASRVSALIQEIYSKQQQRDEAMLGRLRLANEERDRAVALLRTTRSCADVSAILSNEDDVDKFDSALSRVISSDEIGHQTSELIQAVHGAHHEQNRRQAEQLQAALSELERSAQKVRRLEAELLRVERQLEEATPIHDELHRIKAQLTLTQQERDLALTKLRKTDEENETLKVYYSLHKSLSKEQSLRDQYNNSLDQMQMALRQREGTVLDAQKETNRLQATIQQLTYEKDELTDSVEKLTSSLNDSTKQSEKLQRHIVVLQRKLRKMSTEQGTV